MNERIKMGSVKILKMNCSIALCVLVLLVELLVKFNIVKYWNK